jgi:membrane-bound lytic murein transglycosylase A
MVRARFPGGELEGAAVKVTGRAVGKKAAFRRAMTLGGLVLTLLAGCAPRAGLFPIDGGRLRGEKLQDEKDFLGLPRAVRQSISYYRRLPEKATFRYGEHVYTAREMEASMLLFLDIVESLEGEERREAIASRFLFFESRNDRGGAFFTGYYEPVLTGSLQASDRFTIPLHGVPEDLVRVDLSPYIAIGLLPEDLENRVLRGRIQGRKVVPYGDREEIVYGKALEGKAEVLAYLSDHVELSFLQIQGSGLVRLGDGTFLRLNYADQNGRPYRAIGRPLLDRIPREEMSLQRIRDYLYGHPEEVREILNFNPSYTFFRIVEEGPLGYLEVPLTPGRSVAMDHRLFPRGSLVWFETSYPRGSVEGAPGPVPFSSFATLQDTGGAIRGHGRADIFWGSGEEAERIAGPMKEEGRILLLVARKEYLEAPIHRQGTPPSP